MYVTFLLPLIVLATSYMLMMESIQKLDGYDYDYELLLVYNVDFSIILNGWMNK